MITPQKPRSWELKLSPAQLLITVTLITGSMAIAFYLGLSTGESVGYESASRASLSTMARLPIPTEELDPKASAEMASEMYAKLTAPTAKEPAFVKGATISDHEMPEVGAIPSTESIPILPDAIEGATTDKNTVKKEPAASQDTTARTLGSLVQPSQGETASVKAAEEVKPVEQKIEKNPVAAVTTKEEIPALNEATVSEKAPEETVSSAAAVVAPKVPSSETAKVSVAAVPPAVSHHDGAAPLKEHLPNGWYVQVAAPRQLPEAYSLASQIQHVGIPVMIETAQVRGESYYRVVAGPRTQKQGAEALLEQIRSKHSINADPFLRAVK